MSAENELSITSTGGSEASPVVRGRIIPRSIHPYAVIFVFLSVTVTLWGFGYKLSRYNPHPDITARAISAKLWDKHEDVSKIAGVLTARGQAELPLELHGALLLFVSTPLQQAFFRSEDCASILVWFHSAIPLRSPPSYTLVA